MPPGSEGHEKYREEKNLETSRQPPFPRFPSYSATDSRRIVDANFIVHVRTGGAAADAGVADDLAAFDSRARHRRERRKMRVPGGDAETMIQHNQATVAGMVFSDRYNAIRRSMHRRAVIGGHIHACVERAFAVERIQAFPEAVCDVPHHRP